MIIYPSGNEKRVEYFILQEEAYYPNRLPRFSKAISVKMSSCRKRRTQNTPNTVTVIIAASTGPPGRVEIVPTNDRPAGQSTMAICQHDTPEQQQRTMMKTTP